MSVPTTAPSATAEQPAPPEVPAELLDDFLELHDCRPEPTGDECDDRALQDLQCRNEALAQESAYRAGHQPLLASAHKDFDAAKRKYRDNQREAATRIRGYMHDVSVLVERLECRIDQPRAVRCLDDKFETVSGWLDCCVGSTCGCSEVPEVEFGTDPPAEHRKLVRRVRRYVRVVEDTRKAFKTLVAEPDELTKRVAAVGAELTAIAQLLDGGTPAGSAPASDATMPSDTPTTPDLKELYARALLVRRRLEKKWIWNGFGSYAEFEDCLCRALTTWTDGVEAIAVLVGVLARRTCAQKNADAWCAKVVSAPEAEVLALYERSCGTQACDDSDEHDDDCRSTVDDGPEREPRKPWRSDDDCGCGGGHRRHPHHPRGGHPGFGPRGGDAHRHEHHQTDGGDEPQTDDDDRQGD
ncbi:hypothetical protein ACWFNE_06890 [Cellulomonas sp. NPDC055163]